MEKSGLLLRDPVLSAAEMLHNANAEKGKPSGRPVAESTRSVLQFQDALEQYYIGLFDANTNRREYLLEQVGGKKSEKKYCRLPGAEEPINKGQFDAYISEQTRVSVKSLQNRLLDDRYRPDRKTVDNLSKVIQNCLPEDPVCRDRQRREKQARFYRSFGYVWPTQTGEAIKAARSSVIEALKKKWPGSSYQQLACYLGLALRTVANIAKGDSVDNSTAYHILIVLGKSDPRRILGSFDLYPIPNGEADGLSEICAQAYPELFRAISADNKQYALEFVSAEFWGLLNGLLQYCDKRFHRNLRRLLFNKESVEAREQKQLQKQGKEARG